MAAPPETLVLRALKLGDLLVAVPAIHAIRRARTDQRLVWAVPAWMGPIVVIISGVDMLHRTPGLEAPLDIAPGRVHTAINMHGNGPESRAVIDALDAPHVVAHGGSGPAWLDGILERWRWVRLVEAVGMPGDPDEVAISRPLAPVEVPGAVVIHVGAFYGSRQWPVERFARVARVLTEQGRRVVLTGSAAERPRAVAVARQAGLETAAVQAGTTGLAEFA